MNTASQNQCDFWKAKKKKKKKSKVSTNEITDFRNTDAGAKTMLDFTKYRPNF